MSNNTAKTETTGDLPLSSSSLRESTVTGIHTREGLSGQEALGREVGLAWGLHVDCWAGDALAVLLGDRLALPAAQQQLHLLAEEAGGQRVQDGVQGTVDGQHKDHHPGVYGAWREQHACIDILSETATLQYTTAYGLCEGLVVCPLIHRLRNMFRE